jgi:hypothetical protein
MNLLSHLQPDFSDAYVRATYPFRFAEHLALFNEGLRRAGWKGTRGDGSQKEVNVV